MEDRCFTHEELDELLTLGSDDPRRDHLARCSACRTLLASYRAFMEAGDLPEASDRDEAGRRLDLFRARMIEGVDRPAAVGATEASLLSRLLAFLRGPILRPALAGLLLLIAAGSLWMNRDSLYAERSSGIVREVPLQGSVDVTVQPPVVLDDGGLVLEWSPVSSAESYRVQILGVEMTPLRDFTIADVNRLRVTSDDIEGLASSGPLFWRVIVYRNGDEFARSSLHSLP